MSLDPAVSQRIRTFVAAVEPRFDDITREFFDRFEKSCPGASKVRPVRSKRSRYAFAAAVSMVMKHVDNFDGARAVFEHMSHCWQRAGLNAADLRVAQSCLVSVLRDVCASNWSSETESDVSAAIHAAFEHVQLVEALAARKAA